jgi:prolyl-tRNA editing enzyme YbaK/EbsC (Cys-tRNA(Pro) deacylase)
MSLLKAKQHLEKYNLGSRVIEFDSSTATVELAALQVGVTEGEIAKSLSFLVGEQPILVIVAGDKKIDNHKFKEEFKVKAKMIPFDLVEILIGHAAGGVCPFGINDNVLVYLDKSLKQYEYIYPACGTSNTAVKLLISELELSSNYVKWVDVCKEGEL